MRIGPQRSIDADSIVAPQGYRVETLITGLAFPSAISFGPGGELYLAESGGACGTVVGLPRVLRVDPDRSVNEIGRLDNPILGLVYRNGELLIGEDGPAPRILRVTTEGEVKILVESLPGGGDYGLSGLSLDPSGALLFGIGTRTNSGVVGLDNVARGWAASHPDWADVPGADIRLEGINYVTAQPGAGATARVATGGFKAFGRRSDPGEAIRASIRCSGAVYRLPLDATEPERLAWGFRNPVGVAAGPDGRVFASEGGMEERGSRPVAGAPDNLWEVQPGGYYGWPDYASGIPVTEPRFRLPGHPLPRRLLRDEIKIAGTPAATFPARSGVGRFDFATSPQFGFAGDALVALSGEWSAAAYAEEDAAPGGYRVVRVNLATGETTDFLVNRQGAPASAGGSGGLERPFDVRFDPTGEVLYVVDMGEVHLNREFGLEPFGGTGVVWRITRIRPTLLVPPVSEPAAEPEAEEPAAEAAPEPEAAPPDDYAPDEPPAALAPTEEAPEAAEAERPAASEEEGEAGTASDTAVDSGEAPAISSDLLPTSEAIPPPAPLPSELTGAAADEPAPQTPGAPAEGGAADTEAEAAPQPEVAAELLPPDAGALAEATSEPPTPEPVSDESAPSEDRPPGE